MTELGRYESFLSTPNLFLDSSVTTKAPFHTDSKAQNQPLRIHHQVFGKRMEEYFQFYIEQCEQYELLKHGLQIIENKVTIGELDFLIREIESDQVIHIELVTKFYLYDPKINGELERWIGPNRKDSLIQKLEKLKTKQFPIIELDQTKAELKNLDIEPTAIERRLCFKAMLFLPYSNGGEVNMVNQECIAGYWLNKQQFEQTSFHEYEFFIPEKLDWYCSPERNEKWHSYSAIEKEISTLHKDKKSPMIWIKKDGTQFERGFVVWW